MLTHFDAIKICDLLTAIANFNINECHGGFKKNWLAHREKRCIWLWHRLNFIAKIHGIKNGIKFATEMILAVSTRILHIIVSIDHSVCRRIFFPSFWWRWYQFGLVKSNQCDYFFDSPKLKTHFMFAVNLTRNLMLNSDKSVTSAKIRSMHRSKLKYYPKLPVFVFSQFFFILFHYSSSTLLIPANPIEFIDRFARTTCRLVHYCHPSEYIHMNADTHNMRRTFNTFYTVYELMLWMNEQEMSRKKNCNACDIVWIVFYRRQHSMNCHIRQPISANLPINDHYIAWNLSIHELYGITWNGLLRWILVNTYSISSCVHRIQSISLHTCIHSFNSFTTMLSYTENLIGFDSTIFCMIFKQNNTIFSFAAWKQTNNTNTTTLFNIFIYCTRFNGTFCMCVSASVFLFLFSFFALAWSKHKWTKREQSWNNLLPFTWALINYEHNKS